MTIDPSQYAQSDGSGDAARLIAPAADRNVGPIQEVLSKYLPASGRVLEIASGTGQHIVAHGAAFPHLTWQPTEHDPARRASIEAYRAAMGLANVLPVKALDACARGWAQSVTGHDALIVVNLLHLITDADMAVFLDEAAQSLAAGGMLAIYGPFLRDGETTSPGDAEFHAELTAGGDGLGYKDLSVVASVLEVLQLRVTTHTMPANNVLLVARRT